MRGTWQCWPDGFTKIGSLCCLHTWEVCGTSHKWEVCGISHTWEVYSIYIHGKSVIYHIHGKSVVFYIHAYMGNLWYLHAWEVCGILHTWKEVCGILGRKIHIFILSKISNILFMVPLFEDDLIILPKHLHNIKYFYKNKFWPRIFQISLKDSFPTLCQASNLHVVPNPLRSAMLRTSKIWTEL